MPAAPAGNASGATARADLLLPRLAQHGVRLDAHPLHRVHHHKRAVAQAGGGGDLGAKVHVAG